VLEVHNNPLTSVPAEWEEGGALEQSGQCAIYRSPVIRKFVSS